MDVQNFKMFIFSFSAFLFYALILTAPSGYSYGSLLCLFAGMIGFTRKDIIPSGVFAAIYILACGVFFIPWEASFSQKNDFELFLKYVLCAGLCISLIGKYISARLMVFGMCLGALLCLGLSVYQFIFQGRANGFTNAIRYGNISALISFWLFTFSFLDCFSKKERVIIMLSGLAAISSSFLSLSRGGWLIYLVIALFAIIHFRKKLPNIIIIFTTATFISVIFYFSNGPQRISNSIHEINSYQNAGNESTKTSIGARLEMYRFAMDLIKEKPILGWGDKSIRNELEYRINEGLYDEYLLSFPHLHNDFLDTLARRGVAGGIILMIIYITPVLYIFNEKKKNQGKSRGNNENLFDIAVMSLPMAYATFGLTDVFFHINISHIFYAFSFLFLFAARSSGIEIKELQS